MTFLELQTDLDNRISAAKVTGFWSVAAKKEWLNQAGQRVCDYKPWEFLKTALYLTTRDSREYYDYPVGTDKGLKYNSIYNIVIADEDYLEKDGRTRKKWDDFQRDKLREGDELIYSNHSKWYFLYPVPEDGKEMVIYGLRRWVTLVDDTDEPISPREFDEAIVRIALAACMRKAKKWNEANAEVSEILSPEGGQLMTLWDQEGDEGPRGYGGQMITSRFL